MPPSVTGGGAITLHGSDAYASDPGEQIKGGRLASLVLPGATPLQGGVPITYEGKVIGAIGVSGNTPKEDEEIALVGAAAAAAALSSR